MARLLSYLARAEPRKELDSQLQRLATRIANNRVVAGVHFHIDSVAGRMVAESLAEYFIRRSDVSLPGWVPREFDGASLSGNLKTEPELGKPLDRREVMDDQNANNVPPKSKYFRKNVGRAPLKSATPWGLVEDHRGQSLLGSLWAEVRKEWR